MTQEGVAQVGCEGGSWGHRADNSAAHALDCMVTLWKEGLPWLIQPLGGAESPRVLRQSI